MRPEPTCPRCGGEVRPPGLWASSWQCARHGPVQPFTVLVHPGPESLEHVVAHAGVPVWLPHGLGAAWTVSGVALAGDERAGARATATCLSGPSPLGGAADLLLVAEEPGLGLGARYAGLPGPDPGDGFGDGAPDAKVLAAGHVTPLWSLPTSAECAAFVGEAMGLWLWVIVWPAAAGVLLYDDVAVRDARDGVADAELAFGALSPRLTAVPTSDG